MLAEMRCILVLLLLAVASLEALPRPGENEDRIADGVDSPPGAFPFLPALRILANFRNKPLFGDCSSTVISKRHILTAAHCIVRVTAVTPLASYIEYNLAYFMNFGEYLSMSKNNTGVPLDKFGFVPRVIAHPSYDFFMTGYDIAIIEFPEGTDFGIEPIALAKDYVAKDDDEAFAAGYGMIDTKYVRDENGTQVVENTPSGRLRNTTVSIYTEGTCFKKHVNNSEAYRFTHNLICMGKETKTALGGDSGGPLMIERKGKKYQIGVTSFGITEANSPYAFYTPVSLYCDFISKATKGEVKCESVLKEPQPPSKPGQSEDSGGPKPGQSEDSGGPKPGQSEDSGGPKPGQSESLVASTVTMNNLSAVLTILMVLLQFF